MIKIYAIGLILLLTNPAPGSAQKLGKGGIGIDNETALPKCDKPLGTIALVEKAVTDPFEKLPEGIRALAALAESQNGKDGPMRVDPIPIVRLMAANSGCFLVAERGESYEAVKRERALSGLDDIPVTPATHILNVQLLYSDANSRGGAGGVGGTFGSAVGLKTKTLESQILLTLVDVKTGLQTSIATGSARKKDVTLVGGGLLVDLGIGALGGTYSSTNIGKITALATLDAFRKFIPVTQSTFAAQTSSSLEISEDVTSGAAR
jgi:hypothetical protein